MTQVSAGPAQRGTPSVLELPGASDRLRADWVVDWLTDPQKEMPGTRMPSFFYSDGEPLMEEPDAKIRVIRDYLMELGAGRSGGRAAVEEAPASGESSGL